ncbi:MAG: hypothetical protein ABIA59_07290, partial [Candidatus Latescibacterota bacterium]
MGDNKPHEWTQKLRIDKDAPKDAYKDAEGVYRLHINRDELRDEMKELKEEMKKLKKELRDKLQELEEE